MAEGGHSALGTKTRAALQVGAGVVLTVLLLVAAEIACGFFVEAGVDSEEPITFRDAGNDFVSQALKNAALNPLPTVKDLDLLWRNAPSAPRTLLVNPQAYGRKDTWTIRINSEGFRGPERETTDAGEGVYRVLFIGDSVTFGYGVEERDSFVRRVEAALRARHPDRRFDIVNAGVPGWSWVQGLRFLQLRGLSLHPNLVVMAHGANDQFFPVKLTDNERIKALESPAPRLLERVRHSVSRTNMYRVARRLVATGTAPLAISPGCARQISDTGGCRRVGLDEIEAAVHVARKLTLAAGADLLVLNLDFLETPAIRAVRAAVDADHIPFIDFAKQFDDLSEAEQRRGAQDHGLAARHAANNGQGQTQKGARHVTLRVLTGDLVGPFSVRAFAFPDAAAFQIAAPLYDDGTHGDELANDHVASTIVDVPAGVGIVHYRYYADGIPEFASPEGSIPSDDSREVRLQGDMVGPVDVFGQQFLMIDRTHPNSEGHRVIAEGVLQALDSIGSFRKFVGQAE
jgi:lysophospholipase L1-like esterase